MKIIIVNEGGEVAVITPDQLQLVQVADGVSIVGVPATDAAEGEKKVFPLAQFNVNLTIPAAPAPDAPAPAPEA